MKTLGPCNVSPFVAQSHTPCNHCVRFATTVASGRATLATKRTLLLTWAGLPPAGSHQLAAGALTRSPRRRGRATSAACRPNVLLRLEACKLHHLAPFLGLVGDELSEIGGGAL